MKKMPAILNLNKTWLFLKILHKSIPSSKAEPFKQWMAKVASQRLDQMQDPELNFEQAYADYRRLGYSDKWINQRRKSVRHKIPKDSGKVLRLLAWEGKLRVTLERNWKPQQAARSFPLLKRATICCPTIQTKKWIS